MVSAKLVGAAIVTRVSTGEQVKHGTSLKRQLEMCRAKAHELGLPEVAEHSEAGAFGSSWRAARFVYVQTARSRRRATVQGATGSEGGGV